MSTSPSQELRFYLNNLTRFWLGPKFDLPRIPGPPGWRVVGNAPELARRKDLHRVVLEWCERYGGGGGSGGGKGGKGGSSGKEQKSGSDESGSSSTTTASGPGIIKFWLFGQPIVVVSDPLVAAQVLARPGGGFRAAGGGGSGGSAHGSAPPPPAPTALPRKSIGYSFFDLCSSPLDGLRSFFSTSDEAHWAAVRKAAAPAFSPANVRRRYFPVVLKHADALAAHVRAEASPSPSSFDHHHSPSPPPPSRPIELQEHIEIAMLDVALEALFGVDLRRVNSEEVARAMALVLEEAQERVKFPLRGALGALLWPGHARRVRSAQRTLAQLYARIHDSVRERGVPPASETALWACLARLRDPSDPEGRRPLPRARFMSETGAMMMAAFDTSSHSAGWVLLALAAHPDVQGRLKAELARAGLLHTAGGAGGVENSGGNGVAAPRQLTFDDLDPPRLPYLCAVVAEAMRLWPVGATGSVRETTAPAGTRVGPYLLPPGVVVWPMIYALHTSSRNWGEGAREFRPERWLDAETGEFVGAAVAAAEGAGAAAAAAPPAGPTPAAMTSGGAAPAAAAALPPAGLPPAATGATPTSGGRGRGGGGSGGGGPAQPKRFLPFSDGGKACLGQQLGLTEVKAVVASLCSRFWFELPPHASSSSSSSSSGGEAGGLGTGAREQIALTLKIRGGLRLVCKPHGGGVGGGGGARVEGAAAAGKKGSR